MKTLKSLVSWIEIPVIDMQRACDFYENILGIKLQVMPLGELTMAFFPVEESGVGGALCKHDGHYLPSENGIIIYLKADPSIDEMLEKVVMAKGTVITKKKQISENPDYGFMALIKDTEGNKIALYEK